jgi:hypothetical protein
MSLFRQFVKLDMVVDKLQSNLVAKMQVQLLQQWLRDADCL